LAAFAGLPALVLARSMDEDVHSSAGPLRPLGAPLSAPKKRKATWNNPFLSGKSWHPLNQRNQKLRAEAEEKAEKQRKADDIAREEAAKRDEFAASLASLPGREQRKLKAAASVSFLYQRPPGYDAMKEREKAAETAEPGPPQPPTLDADARLRAAFGLAAQPPGAAVRCLRCRAFGHEAATCTQPRPAPPLSGSRLLEDPLTLMKARSELQKGDRLQLLRPGAGLTGGLSPPRGGGDAGDEQHQLLPAPEARAEAAEVGGADDEARRVLAQLGELAAREGDAAVKAALDELPRRLRKRVLKAFERERKARRRREEEARVAAAHRFLESTAPQRPS